MYEGTLFMDSLREVLGPMENPRYLLRRKSFFYKKIERTDYHPVPEIVAKRKEYAWYFHDMWRHYVGSSELVLSIIR